MINAICLFQWSVKNEKNNVLQCTPMYSNVLQCTPMYSNVLHGIEIDVTFHCYWNWLTNLFQVRCVISDPHDSVNPLKSAHYKVESGSSTEMTNLIVGATYNCSVSSLFYFVTFLAVYTWMLVIKFSAELSYMLSYILSYIIVHFRIHNRTLSYVVVDIILYYRIYYCIHYRLLSYMLSFIISYIIVYIVV